MGNLEPALLSLPWSRFVCGLTALWRKCALQPNVKVNYYFFSHMCCAFPASGMANKNIWLKQLISKCSLGKLQMKYVYHHFSGFKAPRSCNYFHITAAQPIIYFFFKKKCFSRCKFFPLDIKDHPCHRCLHCRCVFLACTEALGGKNCVSQPLGALTSNSQNPPASSADQGILGVEVHPS